MKLVSCETTYLSDISSIPGGVSPWVFAPRAQKKVDNNRLSSMVVGPETHRVPCHVQIRDLISFKDLLRDRRTHHGGDKDDFSGTLKSVFDWELCSTSGFP